MVSETAAAIQGLKAAISIVRGMKSLDDRTAINLAVIDLQSHLLDTQQAMIDLQDKVQEMKVRIAELERFSYERFELVELVERGHRYSGRRIYREKETSVNHCPGCFSESKLTPVQFSANGTAAFRCKARGLELGVSDDWESPPAVWVV